MKDNTQQLTQVELKQVYRHGLSSGSIKIQQLCCTSKNCNLNINFKNWANFNDFWDTAL